MELYCCEPVVDMNKTKWSINFSLNVSFLRIITIISTGYLSILASHYFQTKLKKLKKLLKNGLRALVIWKDSLEVNQNALIGSLLVGIWHTDRFLSKCHVINYLRSSCRSLFDERRCARSVLTRPRANIPQYGPHA